MAEKEQILKEKVEFTGIFDFAAFYGFAHSWFKELGYGVIEEKYSEKAKGDSRDITVEWKASKDISDYFRYEYKLKFEIEGLGDVEVEIDGERKKSNKGKATVEITGTLVMDKDAKWETSPFNRFMRDIYNKYIIPARVDAMREEVANKARQLKEDLKMFLSLTARR